MLNYRSKYVAPPSPPPACNVAAGCVVRFSLYLRHFITRVRRLCLPSYALSILLLSPPLSRTTEPTPQLFAHAAAGPLSLPLHSCQSILPINPQVLRHISPEGKDLVRRLLARDPEERPSAEQVMSHPWLRAVVTRSKATTASHRLIRRRQQQHQRHAQPVEGTWGLPPRPRDAGVGVGAGAGAGLADGGQEGGEGAAQLRASAARSRSQARRQRQAVAVRREEAAEGGEGGATAAPGLAEAAAVVASVAGDHLSEMI